MTISKLRTLTIFIGIGVLFVGALAQGATLELISSAPTSNAIDVPRTDALTLQFSIALARTSVNANTVALQSTAGTQQVALSVSGTTISVRPLTPLAPWTSYTLNATSLLGSNGEQLAAPIAIAFQTRDAKWQAPQLIDRLTSEQWNPVTATNAKGIRFVAWLQSNSSGAGDDIWAVRHVPGGASDSAMRIASFPDNYISELNVFVDEDGNALVTWVGDRMPSPPTPWHQWVNRFVAGNGPGSGWGTPQIIDGYSKRSATNLHLVFDHDGNAFALWQEYDCCAVHSLNNIVTNRYTRATGWSKPIYLDTSGSFGGEIDIQVDGAGNAYAVWRDFPAYFSSTNILLVSHYEANVINGGWSAARKLVTESTMSSSGDWSLTVNHHGDAFVMWASDTGLKYSRTDEFGRWGTPILVDASSNISPTQLVLLDDGEAFAAFLFGVRQYNPAKQAWSWAHPLLTNQNASSAPRIVADESGNALVAWTQNVNGTNRIYAKRYRANRGWFSSVLIDSGNTLGAQLQDLFIEPNGSAVAAWSQNNEVGTTDVEAARFE